MIMTPPTRRLELAGDTHVGLHRKRNEDSFVICRLGSRPAILDGTVSSVPDGWAAAAPAPPEYLDTGDDPVVLAVADGVGGGPGGDVASRMAVASFPVELARRLADGPGGLTMVDLISRAARSVHEQVVEAGGPESSHPAMASTLTAWVARGDRAWLLQIGDSRCYRLRAGTVTRLSRDQTLAEDLVADGTVASLDRVADVYHNTLTSTVGGHNSRPVVTELDRQPGDVVLVCSDGITKHVDDEHLAHLLRAPMAPREVLGVFFEAVLADGATDNLTAIIARETP